MLPSIAFPHWLATRPNLKTVLIWIRYQYQKLFPRQICLLFLLLLLPSTRLLTLGSPSRSSLCHLRLITWRPLFPPYEERPSPHPYIPISSSSTEYCFDSNHSKIWFINFILWIIQLFILCTHKKWMMERGRILSEHLRIIE